MLMYGCYECYIITGYRGIYRYISNINKELEYPTPYLPCKSYPQLMGYYIIVLTTDDSFVNILCLRKQRRSRRVDLLVTGEHQMKIEFERLGRSLVGCIVADVVVVAILVKSQGKWEIDDMIPSKYLNAEKHQEINDAINKKLNELNSAEVVKIVSVSR